MAKYTFNFACGHGTKTITLFGKGDDRRAKLAWYERNYICPECFKKQQIQEDNKTEQIALLKYRMGSIPHFSVVLQGKTFANKESLKELGFVWREDPPSGLQGLFANHSPFAWQKTFPAPNEKTLSETLKEICQQIKPLGYFLKESTEFPLNIQILLHQWSSE